MELVTDARVLILDEPTSGLDAYNARNLLQLLSDVAQGGGVTGARGRGATSSRIVLASLHQPSPVLFDMLDEVNARFRFRAEFSSLVGI